MSRYLKSITALFTGVIGWAAFVVASAPAEITAPEWIMLAVAVGTALGVYAVPNQRPATGFTGNTWGATTTGTATGTADGTYTIPEPAPVKPPPVKPVKKTAKDVPAKRR